MSEKLQESGEKHNKTYTTVRHESITAADAVRAAHTKPKVAIVHDWLNTRGGAERVAVALQRAFPDAPIYTSIYEPSLFPELKDVTVHTTWLQKFPAPLRRLHKLFPVLRVWAFRSLDLREFDIIISSSSAESKQVQKRDGALHFCYCHTPIRYYWNMYDEYRKNPPFGKLNPLIKPIIPPFVRWMRRLDFKAAQNVDFFIANSNEVKARIQQYYSKDSIVIHPPVDTDRFTSLPEPAKRTGYIALGRQEPYKRIDLAVAACTALNLPLTVLGNGSEHQKLVKMAGPTVTFITNANDQQVAEALKSASGFIFPAFEDFGIVQVEALAAGTPVIAYSKGGALDIVTNGVTGILFDDQTVDSLSEALKKSEQTTFDPKVLTHASTQFDVSIFISKIKEFVKSK